MVLFIDTYITFSFEFSSDFPCFIPIYADEKVTVLESEKRAYESSPEAEAMREALNPWRKHDAEAGKQS